MKIAVLVGTRPEAIKMAPVIRALRLPSGNNMPDVRVCSTGQHREMLSQALADFGLTPDVNLDVMTENQSLAGLSAHLMTALDRLLAEENPDWVLVQGDTTTVMIASLCAYYRHIRVGHVEAGLRSFNKYSPFPEEVNRQVTGVVAHLHFAPSDVSRDNLLREGVRAEKILVTGNTIVDALEWMLTRDDLDGLLPPPCRSALDQGRKILLVTCHRRESFGAPIKSICSALNRLTELLPECHIVYPVHRNPNVHNTIYPLLESNPRISLIDPLPYAAFVSLMRASYCILSDSGGIQEEVATLRKPLLVLREVTERPEGIEAGFAKLVGADEERIVAATRELFADPSAYASMQKTENPYGDGKAAVRIREALLHA
jgi:UDP-N-acetylglucosamine 2-epimerase